MKATIQDNNSEVDAILYFDYTVKLTENYTPEFIDQKAGIAKHHQKCGQVVFYYSSFNPNTGYRSAVVIPVPATLIKKISEQIAKTEKETEKEDMIEY